MLFRKICPTKVSNRVSRVGAIPKIIIVIHGWWFFKALSVNVDSEYRRYAHLKVELIAHR